ncbi:hypothetical protein [Salinicola sp. CPA57]|uniref:hypothetical protein n=1 Tax=unclassified Salinicola TaxID=2634022 RepID=UPI000DA1148C|nr:hypothetical protein [Salinicola sp. CPA57]
MAGPSKKPARGKGAPPTLNDTPAVASNTSQPADGEKTTFNTRVPPEWKRRLKVFCVEHNIDMVDFMMEAVDKSLREKGG